MRVVRIRLDHLARHGDDVRPREHVEEVEVRILQLEGDGVLVPDHDAGNLLVVVELAGLLRLFDELVEPHDLVLEEPLVRAAVLRVAEALDRVLHVARDQLPLLALERGIVGVEDAGPDAKGVARALLLRFRHRLRCERHDLHRAREVVVREQRLEDVLVDAVGVAVVDALRIEARLRGAEASRRTFFCARHPAGEGEREDRESAEKRRNFSREVQNL
jgi:hypothetical protein